MSTSSQASCMDVSVELMYSRMAVTSPNLCARQQSSAALTASSEELI